LTKRAELDFDKKKQNWILTEKNAQLRVEKNKKKIKKESVEHRTAANPPPKAHTQKPNGGGYAAVQPFCTMKKKDRSSIKQKEVN
jgi:hypothetical protein